MDRSKTLKNSSQSTDLSKHYFITGTSSGIGKAYAEFILDNEADSYVVGISRREVISHERYTHIALDLANREAISHFQFDFEEKATELILLNNAGYIGDIKRIGEADTESLFKVIDINVSAVLVLCNSFIKQSKNLTCNKTILNISSGAANYPIDAWAPYCTSKAAIDHLTNCLVHEQDLTGGKIQIKSVSPGVVDTEMQQAIRSSNEKDFSRHNHFVNLHENGELASPKLIAQKLSTVLNNIGDFSSNIISLRDI